MRRHSRDPTNNSNKSPSWPPASRQVSSRDCATGGDHIFPLFFSVPKKVIARTVNVKFNRQKF